ncbi:MAG: PqqD family peptide modification chaperone [Bacteroidales bacterium]|nr:PqqD family peptide modification chaperone [Bacteroidales bacterium]
MKKNKTEKLSVNSVVQRNPAQEFSKIDEEIIMLNVNKGEYYALNDVASRIWEMIDTPVQVNDLLNKLIEEYEIDTQTCQQDTLRCLEDFRNKSIIIIENE